MVLQQGKAWDLFLQCKGGEGLAGLQAERGHAGGGEQGDRGAGGRGRKGKEVGLTSESVSGLSAERMKSTMSAWGTNSSVSLCCRSRMTLVPGVSTIFTCHRITPHGKEVQQVLPGEPSRTMARRSQPWSAGTAGEGQAQSNDRLNARAGSARKAR